MRGDSQKIALIGASGYVGSALRNEGLARGHQVTALVSDPGKLEPQSGLALTRVDVLDEIALAEISCEVTMRS